LGLLEDEVKKLKQKAIANGDSTQPKKKISMAGLGAFKGINNYNKAIEQAVVNKPVVVEVSSPVLSPEKTLVTPVVTAEKVSIPTPEVKFHNPTEIKVNPLPEVASKIEPIVVADSPKVTLKQPEQKSTQFPIARKLQETKPKVTRPIAPPVLRQESSIKKTVTQITQRGILGNFTGSHLAILNFIFNECLRSGSLTTTEIRTDYLLSQTGIKIKTIEKALPILVSAGHISIPVSRRGNMGYRVFTLSESVYTLFLNEREKSFSTNHNPTHYPISAPSKEVSINLNNLTNYTREVHNPTEIKNFNFNELDFATVSPLRPMQVNSSIRKLAQERLQLEEMQTFIDKFMIWVGTQKNVNSILGLFCSKIKEFAEEGDSPVLSVQTEAERQLEIELAQRAEKIRMENDLVIKHKIEQKKIEDDAKFNLWLNQLTDEEKLSFVQENTYMKSGSAAHTALLKDYFMTNIVC
jgi:hypothetical protein